MSIISTRVEYVSDIDWVKLADQVEIRVVAKLKQDLEDWSDDRGMRAMFLGDASDGLRVCELLAEGKWEPVEDQLWKMDTAARDYLYDWIAEIAGEEFFDIVHK